MEKKEFTFKVLQILERDSYEIIKKKHGSVPQITLGEFLDHIFEYEKIPEIGESFRISIQTVNRILRSSFPSIKLLGQRTWKYYFLDLIDLRKCNTCGQILGKEEFHNSSQGLVHKSSECKNCNNEKRTERQKQNPALYKASNAKRRFAELQATPKWADFSKIRIIYENFPPGFQVDHIIPLQGKDVCGLHVETNLQHLTRAENYKKSNKLLPEHCS